MAAKRPVAMDRLGSNTVHWVRAQSLRVVHNCWELVMEPSTRVVLRKTPWNKGKLVGQKAPLRLKDIWVIRVRLQIGHRKRELALFKLDIDSKLRSCCHGNVIASRAIVMQQKTQRPVQFEITEQTRDSLAAWIRSSGIRSEDSSFRVGCTHRRIYPRVNMHGLRMVGFGRSVSMLARMHAHDAADEGVLDIPANEEPTRRAAAPGSHEAGERGALPRNRS